MSDNGTNYSPTSFLEAMYGDGAKGSFDAVAYHPSIIPSCRIPTNRSQAGPGWPKRALQ